MKSIRIVTAVLLVAAYGRRLFEAREQKGESRKGSGGAGGTGQHTMHPRPRCGSATKGSWRRTSAVTTVSASFADGEAAFQAKNYQDATAIFEAYVNRKPGNGWGHYMLGLSAWKSGDFPKAEKAFEQALSIDPEHVKSLVNSARLFIDQKRQDDAIERLTRASQIDPESAEVQRLLARTYPRAGPRPTKPSRPIVAPLT